MEETNLEKLTYEEAFAELEAVVSSLESNQHPLEEAMILFERGQALAQYCISLLDKAELKICQLSGEDAEPEEPPDELQ